MEPIQNTRVERRKMIAGFVASGAVAYAGTGVLGAAAAAPRAPQGFSAAGLKRIDDAMDDMVERKKTPGMLGMVYHRGRIAHVTTAGWHDIASEIPMRRDAIFNVASTTKTMAAVATMILVDEGRLRLDDPIQKFLPELSTTRVLRTQSSPLEDTVPLARPVQVADLLTYRSGFVFGSAVLPGMGPINAAVAHAYDAYDNDPNRWLKALGELPLGFQPGTVWSYHTSVDVLALLLSRASGMRFDELLKQRIFDPLGMKDTSHYVPAAKRSRMPTIYTLDPGTQQFIVLPPIPHLNYPAAETPPPFPKGSAGVLTTADDLLQFARMLLGKGEKDGIRILSRGAVEMMTTNQVPADQRAAVPAPFDDLFKDGIGIGFALALSLEATQQSDYFGVPAPGAFGYAGAFGTSWKVDPAKDLITIFMQQYMYDVNHNPARLMFDKLVYDALED